MGGGQDVTPNEVYVSDLLLWISALALILSFGTTIWNVFSGPSRKNAESISALRLDVQAHALRLSALEQAMVNVPKTNDIHQLELAMTRLQGEMKNVSTAMQGQSQIMERLETIVGRHENHLLDGSQRK